MDDIKEEKQNHEIQLDKASEIGFIAFFKGLEKEEDTIRLFERSGGDYYTLHGDDAIFAAQEVYNTSTVIKYLGGDIKMGLPSVKLSRATSEAFLRQKSLTKRIEIWSNMEGKKTVAWRITKKSSPGNLEDIQDLLYSSFEPTVAPTVLAIKIGRNKEGGKLIGACYIDNNEGMIALTEFIDNEIYNNFESLLIQTGAMECLIPDSDDYELLKIKQVLNRCNVMVTLVKNKEYNINNIESDLESLLIEDKIDLIKTTEYDLKVALSCAACLIKYLNLLEDTSNSNRFVLSKHDLSQYMRLDGSALVALNLLPDSNKNKTMSLHGLLNQCNTAMGTRLLYQWLKQPLINKKDIEERLDLTQSFIEDLELRNILKNDLLKSMPDLNGLARKFRRNKANLQDVIRIYQVIIKIPDIIEHLNNSQNVQLIRTFYSVKLEEYYEGLIKLKELVETTIDLEKADQHIYRVKSEFDESLNSISAQIDEIENKIYPEYQRVANKLNLEIDKKLKFENSNVYGYCFRLSRVEAVALRSHQNHFIELAVQKAGVIFTTKTLKELNEQYNELNSSYNKMQSELVKEVLKIVESYTIILELLNALIAHLDLMVSFATVAANSSSPYVRPQFFDQDGDRQMKLIASRHPCLEIQPNVQFIPNDVYMHQNKREFLIVTGPNMGGKSTYIRQIGAIALMAQLGSFVPCEIAHLPIFDCILARVGANDSQLKGISTFMAEMLETSTILKTATKNSLIIIDELGRGTSTHDGYGLAWSISNYISTQLKSMCLFATHFHELTKLNQQTPTIANLNVKVHIGENQKDLTLLYKVEEGSCDQSLGIQVARMAKFPNILLNLAKRKVDALESEDNNNSNLDQDSIALIKSTMKKFVKSYKSNNLQQGTIDEVLQLETKVEKYNDLILK